MNTQFQKIAIIARQNRPGLVDTLHSLVQFLKEQQLEIVIEDLSAKLIPDVDIATVPYDKLGKHQDLIIVVGGDGSLLHAAKVAAKYNTPVTGINRGSLGFLTDINPDNFQEKISEILQGKYNEEKRFLLETKIHEGGNTVNEGLALNDVVLLPGKEAAQMIEFDIYVNNDFVCHQRSDGLIVSTPTGSTAYALSAGGPIMSTDLDALVLVPMFPHTLSMRPIVISANDSIKITIANNLETNPSVSCDGGTPIDIPPGGHMHIEKSDLSLRLVHPLDYNYFDTLRQKLLWGKKLC